MAIINSLAIGKARGSMGNITYRTRGGATIGSQKIVADKRAGTFSQMVRRTQWGNLVNVWQAFGDRLHPSFEGRATRVSDFNEFMAVNLGREPIYLTRDIVRQGGAVIGGLMITRGSLPAIDVAAGTGNILATDISYPSAITEETTIAQFSRTIINNNSGWQDGDQLSAFAVQQLTNSVTGVPYIEVRAYEVTLNQLDNDTLLSDEIGNPELFTIVDGKIGANQVISGAATWVHSRRTPNGTIVSTQNLIANNALIATYSSGTARTAAIISYGGKMDEQWLTPNIPTADIVTP